MWWFEFWRYLNNHLMNLFAGAWETRDLSPLPVDIPLATHTQVRCFFSRFLLFFIGHFSVDGITVKSDILNFALLHIYTLDSELRRAGESSQETCNPAGEPSNTTSNPCWWYQVLVEVTQMHVWKRFWHINMSFFSLFRKALEDLGIPCFLGGMARGMLGKNSPIHIRQNRRDALKEADLVLLAGNAFSYWFVRNHSFKTIY